VFTAKTAVQELRNRLSNDTHHADKAIRSAFEQSFSKSSVPKAIVSSGSELGNTIFNRKACKVGQFLKVNSAYCNLLGRTEDELLSITFDTVTSKKTVNEAFIRMQEIIDGNTNSYQFEKEYVDKNQKVIPVLLCVTGERDSLSNELLYFVAEVIDLSEIKLLLAERDARLDSLSDVLNMALKEFKRSKVLDMIDDWTDHNG
jgi:PAS domain S-box-containing protein